MWNTRLKATYDTTLTASKSKVGKDTAKVGQAKAFAAKWIKKDGSVLRATADSITDTTQNQLKAIQEIRTYSDPKVLVELKKRKLISPKKVFTFEVSKGPNYSREFVKEETDLTADMLARSVCQLV